jgi:hypothetical protein
MQDRRENKRFPAEFDILIKRTTDSSESIRAKMTNFSSLGLCALVQDRIEVGEKVAIEVVDTRLSKDPMVVGQGAVVYTLAPKEPSNKPLRIGVRFESFDENIVQRLLGEIQARNLEESKQ